MEKEIIKRLDEIEKNKNVLILWAVESGSRAWGFPSKDSDYDVRFIYLRHKNEYLKLEKQRDTMEFPMDGELDFSGWDIQKALKLLRESNPTLFEWFRSPIIYKSLPYFETIKQSLESCFIPAKGLFHYLSMAEIDYKKHFAGETIIPKRYFYALRPILACRWILRTNCPPPILFSDLVNSDLDDDLKPFVKDLLLIKTSTPEITSIPRNKVLDSYITDSLSELRPLVESTPIQTGVSWDKLDSIFLNLTDLF